MTTSKREELHIAVARAIYDGRFWDDSEREVPWAELSDSERGFFLELAADAISVVFAEVTPSIEALMSHAGPGGRGIMRSEALAVLEVLAADRRMMRTCPTCGMRVPLTVLAGHMNERHPRQGVVWQGPSLEMGL